MRCTLRCTVAMMMAGLSLSGCAPAGDGGGDQPLGGPAVEITLAALSLPGVADAEWAIAVQTCVLDAGGACPQVAGATVFARTITSGQFGDGAGSATFVGPCDASTIQNLVSVELLALEDAAGQPLAFRNPGTLTRWVDCDENADTQVRFDVAVLRPADQGFFDVAVDFNAIHCSAKYDCGARDLVHDPATGERGRTHVLGFACTGQTGDGSDTQLHIDDVVIDCGAAGSVTLALPPAEGPDGNQDAAGPDGATTWLYQWATYRGDELLAGLNKRYFNVALGVAADLPATGCTLRTRATADSSARQTLVDGAIPAGVVYPYIEWSVTDLGSCAANHQVNAAASAVTTGYTQTTATEGLDFDHALFAGVGPSPPAMTLMTSGVVTSDLIAALDPSELGQGEGKLADMSGNGRHCTLRGAVVRQVVDGVLVINTGADGTYVWCGDMPTPAYGVHYSLTVKIYGTTLNYGLFARSQSSGDAASPTLDYGYLLAPANQLRWTTNQGISTPGSVWNANQFHTASITQIDDGFTGVKIFVDGTLRVTGRSGFSRNNNPGLMLGIARSSGSHAYFAGELGPTLIYGRSLTDAEVQQNHAALRAYGAAKGFAYGTLAQ